MALVCLAFLLHLRSALVAILILPIAVLISFLVMFGQGISSNIMSLGGIAIAIGAMVDAVIIMIENAHKHLERDQGKKPHWQIIRDASIEVGPTLFYSLLVITVSFLPVFTLQAQEGRLFKPLAFTKTYSMAAAALLSITLAPVLMGWFIRGKIPPEEKNPINRFLIWLYHPVIDFVIRWRWAVISVAAALVVWVFLPWNRLAASAAARGRRARLGVRESAGSSPYQNIGSEFMPPLYEGDLLYMPTTFPGISPTKARELLQPTDRIIKSFPEVRDRVRQDRPRRDRHRSRADGHDRNHHPSQARGGMARRGHPGRRRQRHRSSPPHARRAGGRDERRRPDPRPEQRLDDAHQDAHRHALHRHQDPGRHQGRRTGPRRAGTHRRPRSRRSSAKCRAPPAPSPNA